MSRADARAACAVGPAARREQASARATTAPRGRGGAGRAAGWLLAVACAAALPAAAQDLAAGRRKAIGCQQCHGLDGLSKLPEAPSLAGHPSLYLERSLRAYRTGERRNEVMSVVARTLSDDDIRDLAAYYAAIVVEIRDVPGGKP